MSNEQLEVNEKLGVDGPISNEETQEPPQEADVVQEEQPDEEAQESPDEHPGARKVDTDDPKIKARMDYLFGKMKYAEEQVDAFKKHNQQLEHALEKRLYDFEEKQRVQTNRTVISDLKAQIKDAVLNGDDDRAEELRERMMDIKAEEKANSIVQSQFSQQFQQAHPAESTGFTKVEEEYLLQLQNETDDGGQPRRPWMRDGHPDNSRAAVIADGYIKQNPGASLYDIMEHIDSKITSVRRPVQSNSVGRSGLTPRPNSSNIKLSDAQRRVARQLGISEADYAKQLKLMKGA